MKTFIKYIIPSILLLGIFISLLVSITKLTDLVNTNTTDLVLHDAVQLAITSYVIFVLVILGLGLYVINYIIFITNYDKKKRKQKESFRELCDKLADIVAKKSTKNNDNNNLPINLFKRNKFGSNKEYYDYLYKSCKIWLNNNNLDNNSELFNKYINFWVTKFKEAKPLLAISISYEQYEYDYNNWIKYIPMILVDQIDTDKEKEGSSIDFNRK
jgi:type VI protein secretion system component Hcp